jgi:hypothetical protein
MLDADELEALDDFRFSHRMPSRAAAVRDLLRRGLAHEGIEAEPGTAKSRSYGVISSSRVDGSEAPEETS